jgi:HK97 family phage prohead protease
MSTNKQVRSIERRLVTTPSRLEVRKSTKANSAGNISGYAALYGEKSLPLPFTEIIRKGAFDATLRDGENKFLYYAHDDSRILASLQGDTLTLSSDDKGLRFSADVADTEDGRTVITLAERGDLRGMSFGFIVDGPSSDRWSQDATGAVVRELLAVTLFEISCVGTGAYPKSFFDARNAPAAIRAKLKRDAGDASDVDDDGCSDADKRDPESPCYDPDYDASDFELCSACRAGLCTRCSQNFRSVRMAVDSQGLPMRGGICVRCVRSLCSDCADNYDDFISSPDVDDVRSRRQRVAELLKQAAAQ